MERISDAMGKVSDLIDIPTMGGGHSALASRDSHKGSSEPSIRHCLKTGWRVLFLTIALLTSNLWHEVKGYIEGAGLYDLYLAAQDFREDNPYFVSGKAQLMTSLGWSDEQAEAILAKCVIG